MDCGCPLEMIFEWVPTVYVSLYASMQSGVWETQAYFSDEVLEYKKYKE